MRMTNKRKEVLSVIGKLTLLAAAFVAPNIIQLLKPKSSETKYRYKKIINKMFDDKIIFLSGERIELTEKGLELLKQIQIEDIMLNDMQDEENWDGVWHLVCYDIPEKYKRERDQLRHKLVESNFRLIQLSLWVYPFDCKEGIAVIAQKSRHRALCRISKYRPPATTAKALATLPPTEQFLAPHSTNDSLNILSLSARYRVVSTIIVLILRSVSSITSSAN